MKTIYLRFKQNARADIIERYALQIKDSIEWVDSLDEATADHFPVIEKVQIRLKQELGLEAKLVEKPDMSQTQSRWALCIQK